MEFVHVTKDELQLASWTKRFQGAENCGAFLWFDGKVRNHHEGKQSAAITYECFVDMAVQEMNAIIQEAKERWPFEHFLAVHRIGTLAVGETSILIGVASQHRAEAFFAAQYFIEELKKRVPIWKKEHYVQEGNVWHGIN